jgi:hypothetical protein
MPYLRKSILVLFEDILVYNKSWTNHISYLRTILETLREHQFFEMNLNANLVVQRWITWGMSSLTRELEQTLPS